MRYRMLAVLCVCWMGGSLFAAEETAKGDSWKIPPVQVVDEKGGPLAKAEGYLLSKSSRHLYMTLEQADGKGIIQFDKSNYPYPKATEFPKGEYELLVLSPGRIPAISDWELPATEPRKVTLPEGGRKIELTLKAGNGKPLPENLVPTIMPERYAAVLGQGENAQTPSVWPVLQGNGKYLLTVSEDSTSPLLMLVQHKGYLRGFFQELDLGKAQDSGKLEVELPEAGKLAVELNVFEKDEAAVAASQFQYSVLKYGKTENGINFGFDLVADKNVTAATGLVKEYDDLAPGDYYVTIREGGAEQGGAVAGQLNFRGNEQVMVRPGDEVRATVNFKKFDSSVYKGDGVAEVTVKNLDGSPAAHLPVRVRTYVREAGDYYVVTSGTLTDKGTTTIMGLATGGESRSLELVDGLTNYGHRIGALSFEGEKNKKFDFTMPPKKGDIAPDITLYDVNTSEPVTLSSLKGKVVFLDFWATWCGPCQEPMAHNQKVLEENGERWGDKVVIVGASIDSDARTVVDHVKKNKWESVRHLWCGDDEFSSAPSEVYGIRGVPTAFLIDQEGKILWRGHPSGFGLVEEIDTALTSE